MTKRIILFLSCCFLITFFVSAQGVWRTKACLPAQGRVTGAAFSIGNKGYYVCGHNQSLTSLREVWEYDESTDTWTRKNDFPVFRTAPCSFVINDTAYVGLGYDQSSGTYYTYFWRYEQASDSWTRIADFPSSPRYESMTFTLNGKAYVGCGKGAGQNNDFYQYNPATNTWTQKANFPGAARQNGLGVAIGNYGYMGLGANTSLETDLYRYNPITDSWTPLANFTGLARQHVNFFVLDSNIYISGGIGGIGVPYPTYDDCWMYNVSTNQWSKKNSFTCFSPSLYSLYGFSINRHGYFVCGARSTNTSWNNLVCVNSMFEFSLDSDMTFLKSKKIFGNDTSLCGNLSKVLSTGKSCTLWSTGVTASQITVNAAGTYWAVMPDTCGMVVDTIRFTTGSTSVNITSTDSIFCSGDSARICAPAGFKSYQWNVGDTGTCIQAKQSGNYYVTATDASGCVAQSNHLPISVYPIPSVSIIVQGDTLASFGSVSYRWFFNGTPIPNATSSVYIAPQAGSYAVEVVDTNGCIALSQPVFIKATGIEDLTWERVALFPNPTAGAWHLIVEKELTGRKLEIYNAEGRRVFESEIRNAETDITLNMPGGVYWLVIYLPESNKVIKLVKL